MRGLTLSDKIRSEDICMQLGEEGDIIHDIKVCESRWKYQVSRCLV
jgi:hypothetical protein